MSKLIATIMDCLSSFFFFFLSIVRQSINRLCELLPGGRLRAPDQRKDEAGEEPVDHTFSSDSGLQLHLITDARCRRRPLPGTFGGGEEVTRLP